MSNKFARLMLLAILGWSLLTLACSLSPSSVSSTATMKAQLTELSIGMEKTRLAFLDIASTENAAMTLTAMPTATVNTPTPRPTFTPTLTPTPIPTDTPTVTPTKPLPPTGVLNANGNLRSGPGVAYAVIVSLTQGTKVTVLEKDPDSTWFRVKVDSSGQTGWISINLVTFDFDIDNIAIADVIPPTPTFVPVQPTQPAAQFNFDAHIDVTNRLDVPITIYLTGTYTTSFTVQAGETLRVDLPSGTYNFTAYAYGYNALNGTKTWDAGEYTWEFYAS
jgi:hypothetical protein